MFLVVFVILWIKSLILLLFIDELVVVLYLFAGCECLLFSGLCWKEIKILNEISWLNKD